MVITSYEAAAADAPALKAISWEVVLLDERQRGRAGLAKVCAVALRTMQCHAGLPSWCCSMQAPQLSAKLIPPSVPVACHLHPHRNMILQSCSAAESSPRVFHLS